MPGNLVLQVLSRVWTLLHATGVRAAVMGGIAVSAWKHIRATQDVDLLVAIDDDGLGGVLRELAMGGFHCRRLPPILTIGTTRIIQLLHDVPEIALEIRVDLLLADTDFERQALARATDLPLEGIESPVPVVACEDLIIFKLLAGRILDRADVAYLLRANKERIDMAHLQHWARELALTDDVIALWKESFPDEQPPFTAPPE